MNGNVRQTAPELTWGTLVVTCDNSPTGDGTGPQKAPEGTEDMNSIDNLRDYVLTAPSICSTTRAILVGYLDAIDKDVEELREREYRNGREDAKCAVEFADRLCRASERREDVTLWGVDYTALPVDADGVPIHVGDVMEWCDSGETLEVIGIGDATLFYIDHESDRTYAEWTAAGNKRHHHAPTVEDVLREFVDAWAEWKDGAAMMNPVETFAAKLRLAGEDA